MPKSKQLKNKTVQSLGQVSIPSASFSAPVVGRASLLYLKPDFS
jgi:hypothetical protein